MWDDITQYNSNSTQKLDNWDKSITPPVTHDWYSPSRENPNNQKNQNTKPILTTQVYELEAHAAEDKIASHQDFHIASTDMMLEYMVRHPTHNHISSSSTRSTNKHERLSCSP